MPPAWSLLLPALCLPGSLGQGPAQGAGWMADFTQSLYLNMALENPNANFAFSPLSVHSALAMLYLGTTPGSDTATELDKVLRLGTDRNALKLGYQALLETYSEEQSFLYGNRFWIQEGFTVKRTYLDTVRTNLKSGVDTVDFGEANTAVTVNDWVKRMTGGKIESLVDSFSPSTKLFLANALYFKEQWSVAFEPVEDGASFQTPHMGEIQVPVVERSSENITYKKVRTKGGDIVEVVTIPYKNDLFEMKIFLPASIKEMQKLEETMQFSDTVEFSSLSGNNPLKFNLFTEEDKTEQDAFVDEVYLQMPTFKIKTESEVSETLQKLGVNKVFSKGAELGEMLDEQSGVAVSSIQHKAVVEVTKDGTEGAAATGVQLVLLSATNEKEVLVNRPFIFMVHDKRNKIPVLVGKVVDPTFVETSKKLKVRIGATEPLAEAESEPGSATLTTVSEVLYTIAGAVLAIKATLF